MEQSKTHPVFFFCGSDHTLHTHRHTRSAQLTRIDHLQYATVAHGALPKAQRNSSWIKVELAHRELEVQVLEFDAQFGYANTHTLIDTHTHCVRAIESQETAIITRHTASRDRRRSLLPSFCFERHTACASEGSLDLQLKGSPPQLRRLVVSLALPVPVRSLSIVRATVSWSCSHRRECLAHP